MFRLSARRRDASGAPKLAHQVNRDLPLAQRFTGVGSLYAFLHVPYSVPNTTSIIPLPNQSSILHCLQDSSCGRRAQSRARVCDLLWHACGHSDRTPGAARQGPNVVPSHWRGRSLTQRVGGEEAVAVLECSPRVGSHASDGIPQDVRAGTDPGVDVRRTPSGC